MSGTELKDVQALLQRAMSEPRAFAGRLLQQAIAQYGQLAEPAATAFYTAVAEDFTADFTASETVIVPDEWPASTTRLDTNGLLAAALGACECWGLRAECHRCHGRGSAGWIQPDPELFEEFVRPAISRLSKQNGSNHQSVQGENA